MTAGDIISLVFEYGWAAHDRTAAEEAAQVNLKAAIRQVIAERDEALREHDEALVGLADYARDILKLEKSLEDMEKNL